MTAIDTSALNHGIPYRVIAFHGGGIRGIYQAKFIEEAQRRDQILRNVGLLAGTSTGAIVAAGLALSYTPDAIVKIYSDLGPRVFGKRRGFFGWLRGKSLYDSSTLAAFLSEEFEGRSFGECSTRTFVVAISLNTYQPTIFDSLDPLHAELPVSDVLLATTAAPFYFDPHYIEKTETSYLDGGLVCNNPSHAAIRILQAEGKR